MIHAYVAAGGILEKDLLQAAFYGVIGNLIHWMVYNIKRASKQSEEKKIGEEQVNQAVSTIMKIKNNMPDLMAMIMAYKIEKKESL